jgi:TolB-like protein
MKAFLAELKRRRVYRVAIVYAAVAFVIWQAAEIAVPALRLPEWALTLIVLLTIAGFPIALVLAWAFDITPGGVKATEPGNNAIAMIAGVVVLALAVAAAWLALHDRGSAPAPEAKSIAVLPFANMSADPDNEYFSDGITDDIILHLSKVAELEVISRTSVMRYKDTDLSARQIGEQLSVASVLEGGVQRVGERVRINAQLIDARTDRHIWAEQYDRQLTDIFAIQSDVAQQIAAALEATLTADETERIGKAPTENLEAYDLYLRGRHFWSQRGEGLRRGLQYFQQALEKDPNYARAHAGVADCYSLLGFYLYLPPHEAGCARGAGDRSGARRGTHVAGFRQAILRLGCARSSCGVPASPRTQPQLASGTPLVLVGPIGLGSLRRCHRPCPTCRGNRPPVGL